MNYKRYPSHNAKSYHSIKSTEEFDAIKQRFYEVTSCNDCFELAIFLETTPAQLSDARRRLRLPVQWVRLAFLKTTVDPYWLMTGSGEREML